MVAPQTSANGPNWIQDLRTTYSINPNLKGYNLAYGGATVDAKFVTPYLPTVLSLKGEINVAVLSFLRRNTGLTYFRALQTRLICLNSTLRNLLPRPLGRPITRYLRFGSGSTSEIDCGSGRERGLTSFRSYARQRRQFVRLDQRLACRFLQD